jgi:hypothetical protein
MALLLGEGTRSNALPARQIARFIGIRRLVPS